MWSVHKILSHKTPKLPYAVITVNYAGLYTEQCYNYLFTHTTYFHIAIAKSYTVISREIITTISIRSTKYRKD